MAPSEKRAARRRWRARRGELVAAVDRAQEAERLATHLIGWLPAHLDAGMHGSAARSRDRPVRIAAYESTPLEPPTEALLRALGDAGYEVVVPITNPDFSLDWRRLDDPTGAALGPSALTDVPVILAPALAVDAGGTRLGQGGGCYDRTLAALPRAYVIALLHDGEVSETPLPRDAHDVAVHAMVTPSGGVRELRSAALDREVTKVTD